MRKKSFNILLSLMMLLSLFTLTSPITSSANQSLEDVRKEIKELEKNLNNVKGEKDSINKDISNAQSELEKNKQQQNSTRNDIEQIEQNLQNTQNQIEAKRAEIREKENEIVTVEGEIKELEEEIERLEDNIVQLHNDIEEKEEKIDQREELLKDRLRTLQRNGGNVAYLDVILGAQDFGDFITRTSAVNKIMEQDKKIIEDFFEDKRILEAYKAELEDTKILVTENKEELSEKRDSLETQKNQLVAERSNLEALENQLAQQRTEKGNLLAQLEVEESEIKELTMSLAEEQQILRNQEEALNRLLRDYKEQEKFLTQTSHGTPSTSGFIRPAAGYVSSEFRSAHRPNHHGIDIARAGTVPIVASAGGIVTDSYYSPSYGNVVFITHIIGGQTYTTVYAHLRSRSVSKGQMVQQGDVLGYMGNTGYSFGQHLHFEIHRGQWTFDKRNAVNPRNYINF